MEAMEHVAPEPAETKGMERVVAEEGRGGEGDRDGEDQKNSRMRAAARRRSRREVMRMEKRRLFLFSFLAAAARETAAEHRNEKLQALKHGISGAVTGAGRA